jgi:hypothetical protein
MANSRDIEIDIVGNDRTGRATRSAADNMNRLRRRIDDVNNSNSNLGNTSQRGMRTMQASFVRGAAIIRSAGPYGAIAALGAAIVALPTIAAAAGAGMVLGIGGGLAGIGIKAALANKKVQSAFSKTKTHVTSELKEMAKPFEPVLIRIAQRASKTFDSFRPALESAFKKMAPAIDRFSVNFFKAFKNLIPAIKPVTAAFTDLLDQIGPRLPGIFKNIADAVIDVANALRKNPEAISRVITSFENMIKWTGKVISWLIRLNQGFAVMGSGVQYVGAQIKVILQSIAAKMADVVADVIEAGARIPGPLGKQFRKVAASARAEANKASAALQSMKTDKSRAQIELLQARIRQLKGKKVVTTADRAEIARSQAKIASLRASIASVQGKTVAVRVNTTYAVYGNKGGHYEGGTFVKNSASTDWLPMGGTGTSRVGGPMQVTTGPTTVDTRIYLDGDMITPLVRNTVRQDTSRQAHRARVGRR